MATSKDTSRDKRKFEVVFTGLTDGDGNLRRSGEILTAEELGNVELHLERGAVKPASSMAETETPEPEK